MYHVVFVIAILVQSSLSQQEPVPSRAELEEKYGVVTAHVWCQNKSLDTPKLPPLGHWDRVTSVVLRSCAPAAFAAPGPGEAKHVMLLGELAQSLAARGVKPDKLKRLELIDVPEDSRFSVSYFKGLTSLEHLNITAVGKNRPEQLDAHSLLPLQNVTFLALKNEVLPPLPEETRIGAAYLVGGRSLGRLGGCSHLHALRLRDWILPPEVYQLEGGWLSHCGVLHLWAEQMDPQSLRAALYGASEVMQLELPDNKLTSSDLNFAMYRSTTRLISFDLSRNNLTDVDTIVDKQWQLEDLYLSHNMVQNLRRTLASLRAVPSIRRLWLDYNPLRDYCDLRDDPVTEDDISPLRLQLLSLVSTNISRLCFSEWSSLYTLNLTNNNIEALQFSKLPLIGNVFTLTVDLRQNPLRRVHFNEPDYYALKGARKAESGVVTVHTDPLKPFDCECHNAWLAQALRERRVELTAGAFCHGGEPLSAAPPASLECDLWPCAPCRCRQLWATRTTSVNCEALGLDELPEQLPELGELHFRGNNIDTIRAEDLPETLTLLDLRDNNVSRVDAATAAVLFEVTERRVWLSGNPFACNCDNWSLLNALQAHNVQVEDYENVTCDDGRALQDLSEAELCGTELERQLWVWMASLGGALVGLIALGGALYARYERQMKVWLYARGWCLSCVREEELDADREYDAFVSFAHGDHEFVCEQLMPKLEGDTLGYKVCVHYRDWTPGELIPTQIARSVAASRRTVIVLSASFVNSVWGLLEFRTAHVSALAEGRVRVLVVALEDAPPTDELPEELRLYLRSTTYLSWDDPWFWDKFRYALPHRSKRDVRRDNAAATTRAHVAEPAYGIELMICEQ